MSKQLVEDLLKEAIEVVKEDLRDELNLLQQSVRFTPSSIYKEVRAQLDFIYADRKLGVGKGKVKYKAWYSLPKETQNRIINKVREEAKSTLNNLRLEYIRLSKSSNNVVVEITNYVERTGSFTVTTTAAKGANLKGGITDLNPYSRIGDGYNTIMKGVWLEVAKEVQKEYMKTRIENMSEADKQKDVDTLFAMDGSNFNSGHKLSVAEKQREKSAKQLLDKLTNSDRADGMGKIGASNARQILKEIGLGIVLKYSSTKELTKVIMQLEAASPNKSKGGSYEKSIIRKWEKKLNRSIKEKLVKKEGIIQQLGGSDNRIQIESKKIIKAFDDSLMPKVKRKTGDTKLNLSNRTTKGKITGKVTSTSEKMKPIKAARTERTIALGSGGNRRPSVQSNVTLAALINRALPATVAKNMNLPALRYRTGRFANSVRVTDVTTTQKGFPSIGYTYMKYPYQTFEPGYAQGSADRDPRKLIDKSIRQVAAELLVGRFYTRRV